jgi:regulator of protease activity HflC (stomatin/prohibitin superfamily)
MHKILTLALILAVVIMTGCTRIETGEVGLVVDYNGVIKGDPVGPGMHPTVFSKILVFSGKEVLVPLEKLTPQTADNLAMDDVEVRFAYAVNTAFLVELYTHYSTTYNLHSPDGSEVYAMLGFMDKLVISAVNDQVLKYKALEVNGHRAEIARAIEADVRDKLITEGLLTMVGNVVNESKTKVKFGQVVIAQAVPPKSILASTQAFVDAQNQQRTADTAAQTARIKAQGLADAAVISANGEAKAIQVKTDALRQGGSDYLTLQSIEKWDGKLPEAYYSGQTVPFVGGAIHGK